MFFRLFVQEPAFDRFMAKLKSRLTRGYRIGHSLDKTIDSGAIVSDAQLKSISEFVEEAREEGADVFQTKVPEGCFYPPTLITGVSTASRCVMEEIFGPVLVALPFRTSKEAIALANNTMYGLASSVHSEQLPLALETAKHIKAGTVWINCHNLFDAAAGFGGYKQSGYGRDGGKEGLYEYVKPKWMDTIRIGALDVDMKKFAAAYVADRPAINGMNGEGKEGATPAVDHTYKLYYGGAQKRPDGNYSAVIRNVEGKVVAQVGQSNRKDVRNAVEAAIKAQPGWEKRSGFNRAQILFYIAENLEMRSAEFAGRIADLTGKSSKEAEDEVRDDQEGNICNFYFAVPFYPILPLSLIPPFLLMKI